MLVKLQSKRSTWQGEPLHPVHGFNSFTKGQQNQGKETVFPSLDTLDHNCKDLSVSERKAERLFTRQATKDKLLKLYQTANLVEEGFKLKNCCKKFGTLKCSGNHVHNYYPTERCRLPLCPDCAIYRQKRAFQRLFPKFQQFARNNPKDRLVLITLSVKNSSDNLLRIHQFFKKSFRKLRHEMSNWKTKIRGGIVSFELTIDKDGLFHYHAHILAQRKSFDRYEQSDLSNDWNKATGGKGFIVDIRQIDLKDGFREVLKYTFKPLDLEKSRFDSDKLRQFNELSKRARLSDSFGEFYGLKVEENAENEHQEEQLEIGSPCPTCAEPLHFVLLTRSELTSVLLGQNLLFKPPLIC